MMLNTPFGQPTLWQRLRPMFHGFDLLLLLAIMMVATIGLTTMYSAGYDNGARFSLQVRNMMLAAVVFFVVAQVPQQRLMAMAVPLYTLGVFLLVLTALFGIDPTHKGARRWLPASARAFGLAPAMRTTWSTRRTRTCCTSRWATDCRATRGATRTTTFRR